MNLLFKPSARARALFQMTWPMVIGVLSIMSFQLIDSLFIARLGVEPLAIVGFTIPIYQLIIGFQVGVGIATTALISQLIGAKKYSEAKDYGGHILLLGTAILTALAIMIWLFRETISKAMGADDSLLPAIADYWSIWLFSALVGAILYFGYSICRAHGDTKLPGYCMILTSLLNIAFDPLFIFYFDLGIRGAAYATIAAFLVGGVLIFPSILRHSWLHFSFTWQECQKASRRIISIAAPAITSQLLPALSAIIATSIIASYGTSAVAAWGLGIRFEFFSLILVLALTMSLPPMIGKAYGANDIDEISELLKLAIKFVLSFQLVSAIVLCVSAEFISIKFANAPSVANILESYLTYIPFSYGLLGVCMISISASNAISQAFRGLVGSITRLFLCFIPPLWLGSELFGIQGAIIGAMIGNGLAGLLVWRIFIGGLKNKKPQEQVPEASYK